MPDNDLPDTTNLKSQYVSQVTTDLERNAKDQERIGAELIALQEQLRTLRHDHALLESMRQALTGEAPAGDRSEATTETVAQSEGTAASRTEDTAQGSTEAEATDTATSSASESAAALPKARKPQEANGTRTTKGRSKAARAKKPEAPEGRAPRPRSAGTPTLRELVSGVLGGQSEPRSAAEVTSALTEAHPERRIQPTVVRNTLEALVAKGHVHRTKQQKSVFYSTPADS
ncbi:hypothetical protein ACWCP6_26760 [Streptomyces sp. NPDC002004]